MTAGLPGVGIGGIFYLVCAFLMPFVELGNTLRGRTTKKRWKIVATQFIILCSIILSFWLTGLLLAGIFKKIVPYGASHSSVRQRNIFQIQPLVISLVFLVIIFSALHAVNYVRDRKKGNHPPKGK
jgi:hypothetical protein